MGLLSRFRPRKRKVVVIGLDGTPYSFLQRMIREGRMPNFARLVEEGSFITINSVYPTVSSVAWSCYMTGKNPAKHGIFGFVDRRPDSYKYFIPNSRTMQSKTLWEILSDAGKRVVVINVPVTYPPRPVNGVLIAGFLSPTVEKGAYPPQVASTLKQLGYKLDADPGAARKSKDLALKEVNEALEARARALFHFMDNEEWDFFQCHIMETDRLHHFLWELMEQGHPQYAPAFFAVYERIDRILGDVVKRLDDNTTLIVMSDHGFCTLKKEVYVNYWLAEKGWLRYKSDSPRTLEDIDPSSLAYSLDPGRVFINLKGREPQGVVSPGKEYEDLREEIAQAALELRDPDTGELMIEKVLRREEIYSGPLLDRAADLILVPKRGFDLKAGFGKTQLTFKGDALIGMHTYDDAMFCIRGQSIQVDRTPWVADAMPTVLKLLDVPIPPDLDGKALV